MVMCNRGGVECERCGTLGRWRYCGPILGTACMPILSYASGVLLLLSPCAKCHTVAPPFGRRLCGALVAKGDEPERIGQA